MTQDQAAHIAASIDWNPTCRPGEERQTIVDQVLRAAGEARDENGFTFADHKRFNAAVVSQRDEAEARARQLDASRSTNWAYDQACKALNEHKARIEKALAMHSEFKIYDECDHNHQRNDDDSLPDGVIDVDEIGLTCEDGYMYSICANCCTGGTREWQTEACASDHKHDGKAACWPCPTRSALTSGGEQQ